MTGSCGEGATCSYNSETKVMTISGTGTVEAPTAGKDKTGWAAAESGAPMRMSNRLFAANNPELLVS